MRVPKLVLTHWEDASGDSGHQWKRGDDSGMSDEHFIQVGWHSHTTARSIIDAAEIDCGAGHDFRGMHRLPKGMVVRRFAVPLPEDVRAYVAGLLRRGKR